MDKSLVLSTPSGLNILSRPKGIETLQGAAEEIADHSLNILSRPKGIETTKFSCCFPTPGHGMSEYTFPPEGN